MKLKNKKYFHYKGQVHDLEIQSEHNDHSYNIENIVVHNSAAGSIVAYAIGITDLCPVEYNLLFERFINPERKVMADIDWDSDTTGRDKVVEYLIETYGRDCVSNVATFGTYSPKSALKDMSRGLRKTPETEAILNKKICKMPELAEEGVNKWKPKSGELIAFFEETYKNTNDPEIKMWINDNRDTIRLSDKLQGQMKSIGTHAGGVVVTPEPIYNFVPVMKNDKKLVTAFREADGSSKDLGELGVLKLDVLGLRTLDIFNDCIKNIKQDKGIDLSEKIRYLTTDDKNLIKYFSSGNNYGIFQMDRSAMFTSQFKRDGAEVDSFEDIVAINAMNRPGPLETFLPKYGYWKAIDKGKIVLTSEELKEVDAERYPFEFMRKALSLTYGCLDKDEKVYIPSLGYYVPIKDVVNDLDVFSKNGDFYQVAKNNLTIYRGINDIYKYTFKTGYTLNVTKDHKINTVYGEMEIGQAFEKGISVILPKKLDYFVQDGYMSDYKSGIEAMLFGLMLADGNFKSTNIVLTNSSNVILEWFEKNVEYLFPECKIKKYHKKNNTFDYVVSGNIKRINPFMNQLKEMGLQGKGSRNKFIPKKFFKSSERNKLHLLAGLWDGDGGVTNEHAYYKTKSKQLAEDIVLICRQLGMLPIIKFYKDNTYSITLDLLNYARFAQYMLLDYKKPVRFTHPYYNQIDKEFIQEKIKEKFGSERFYYKSHNLKRKNSGSFYKDQNELSNLCEKLGIKEFFDNNYFVKIQKEEFVKRDEVYDLNIDGEPWFVAGQGGILVHNCLLFQEQFMQMVCDASDFNFGEADSFRRGIAWRKDHPKYHTVAAYYERLEKGMLEKGYSKEDADKFVEYCRKFMGYSFNKSHSVVYSYITWQTLYFKHYYPAYFYAAMLNGEDKEDKIQEIIEDAKKNTIEILPLSIAKSQFFNKPETDTSIRLGYKLIRGMGDAVEAELIELQMHKCTTIDEIMQKPFKKINKTALDNLIKLGCFDEFGVERELIEKLKNMYKEPKIEKWFSRKRSPAEEKTMPECLSEAFEPSMVMGLIPHALEDAQPHIALIRSLTPYLKEESNEDASTKKKRLQKETIDAENELLGFSISADDSFNEFARAMKVAGFKSISDFDEDDPKCYFKVTKIIDLKTKNGKTYWQYTLNDGRKEFKAKVWRENKKIKEGSYAVGILENSQWGFTLNQCEFVK